jgi:hypothetical protein
MLFRFTTEIKSSGHGKQGKSVAEIPHGILNYDPIGGSGFIVQHG